MGVLCVGCRLGALLQQVAQRDVSILAMLSAVMSLLQVVSTATRPVKLIVLAGTNQGHASRAAGATLGLIGLARAARQEQPALGVQCVQLVQAASRALIPAALAYEAELARLADGWRVPRLARLAPLASGAMELHLAARGAISSLQLRQIRGGNAALQVSQAQLTVAAVGLNFRDVLNVLGEYPGDPGQPGLDCAGVVTGLGQQAGDHILLGDSVLGFAFGSLATSARTDARLLTRRPGCISAAQATSLPITWATVHVAFARAALHNAQVAILHTTAGGVGLVSLPSGGSGLRCARRVLSPSFDAPSA